MNGPPLLAVNNLTVHFRLRRSLLGRSSAVVKAVDGVCFSLGTGEALGVVGESGCGKSTLGKAILQLVPEGRGEVSWLGRDLCTASSSSLRMIRREMQMIFQDPLASLDPKMTVERIIGLPLRTFFPGLSRDEVRRKVLEVMEEVGLPRSVAGRYPHQFSGGQCQRIGIARVLIVRPKLIVCDEPTSALDISVQAQIINLLLQLRQEYQMSLLFISHNLAVVRHLCDRVMVLYMGKIVEIGTRDAIFANPRHPYTRVLLDAAPRVGNEARGHYSQVSLQGEPGSPINPPPGCRFQGRCPRASEICRKVEPQLSGARESNQVACHHPH